jgi:hypothetical protein
VKLVSVIAKVCVCIIEFRVVYNSITTSCFDYSLAPRPHVQLWSGALRSYRMSVVNRVAGHTFDIDAHIGG